MKRSYNLLTTLIVALSFLLMAPVITYQPSARSTAPNKTIIGYFPYWTALGGRQTRASAAALDGRQFTHLNFAMFEVIQGVGCREYADSSNTAEIIAGLKDNKLENPSLKIVGTIGGYENSDGSGHFTAAVLSNPQQVVESCYSLLIGTYGLDGIDVNWEHPDSYHSSAMTDLLRRFRTKMGTGKLLTVPLAATDYNGSKYPVSEASTYVDFWNIMALDFYGS